jgi:photosystem II stability/assembly factor-like uncharacterized protein
MAVGQTGRRVNGQQESRGSKRTQARALTLALVAALALAAQALSSPAIAASGFVPPPIRHVWVINLENTSYRESFGDAVGLHPHPYLHDVLPSRGVLLRSYYGTAHNSLSNYIAQVSGQSPTPDTQGDCFNTDTEFTSAGTDPHGQAIGQGCVYPSSVKTIADQLDAKGMSWKGYMEGLGEAATPGRTDYGDDAPCDQHDANTNGGQYAAKHNPYVWFHSLIDQPSCEKRVLPLTALGGDLQSVTTTPNLSFISPDLCEDGHDCGLDVVDRWLRRWVPPILASPAYRQDGMVVVTFDESDTFIGISSSADDDAACCGEIPGPNTPMPGIGGPGGGLIGTVVLSPYAKPGTTSDHPYNHYSLLRSLEDVFGITTGGDDGHGHLGFAGSYDATYPGPGSFGCDVYNAFGPCQSPSQPSGPTPLPATLGGAVGPRPADGSATWQNPLPTSNDLTSISCPSASACFAAGEAGTIVATTDAGSRWSAQRSAVNSDLAGIGCPTPTACYAIGDGGTIVATSDGGATWTKQQSGTSKDLDAITCPTASSCYVVGDGGTVVTTVDSGSSWATRSSGTSAALHAISCPDPSTCFAVGEIPVLNSSSTGTFYRAGVLRTTDGGGTWSIQNSGVDDWRLHAISCPSASTCYVGGDWATLSSTVDGGSTWRNHFGGGVSRYLALSCASASSCVGVGASREDAVASTSDRGAFTSQNAGTSDWMRGVSCPTASTCYAVGDRGTIVGRQDGTHWSAQVQTATPIPEIPLYPPPTRSPQLLGASCPTASACFVVGDGGLIAATGDGGGHWSSRGSQTSERLSAVGCAKATDCVAAGDGGTIVGTKDGTTWSPQSSGTVQGLAGASCPTAKSCFAVGDQGTIVATADHGSTWRAQRSGTTANLNAIDCASASACVAVGALGTILRTTNGGRTWVAATGPVAAAYLSGVSCPTAKACYAAGQDGRVLTTADGGRTWSQKSSGVGDELDAVSCTSASKCVATGSTGTVLSTANSGTSWTAQGTSSVRNLAAVTCPSTTGCVAAGDAGTIVGITPKAVP